MESLERIRQSLERNEYGEALSLVLPLLVAGPQYNHYSEDNRHYADLDFKFVRLLRSASILALELSVAESGWVLDTKSLFTIETLVFKADEAEALIILSDEADVQLKLDEAETKPFITIEAMHEDVNQLVPVLTQWLLDYRAHPLRRYVRILPTRSWLGLEIRAEELETNYRLQVRLALFRREFCFSWVF